MPSMKLLEQKDQAMVDAYLRRYPPRISELTFTNLFVWRRSRPVFFSKMDDTLVFFVEGGEGKDRVKWVFGNPVGPASASDLAVALDGKVAGFVRICEQTADVLRQAGLQVERDPDNADYVYRVEDLAELAGRRFHKKRNLVKQCLERYACTFEPMTAELIPQCCEMQERWCKARQCGHDPGLCNEYVAVQECLTHWESLGLLGGAIRIDGALQAFAVGEPLDADTAVCHFEKAMPDYQGLGQLINQWFAKHVLQDFRYVNREQDLGVPGLRQAKKSYFPDHMVEKFSASFDGRRKVALTPVDPHECGKFEQEE